MISIILVFLAGISKAFMDLSAHGKPFWFMSKDVIGIDHYLNKKYDWWYMDRSWPMKWKNGDPKQGERFLGSSTVFVNLVDGWHLFQFFFLNLMIAAIVFYKPIINPWVDFVILAVVLKGTFQLFYGKLLVKK
jgi:hypothetical protein